MLQFYHSVTVCITVPSLCVFVLGYQKPTWCLLTQHACNPHRLHNMYAAHVGVLNLKGKFKNKGYLWPTVTWVSLFVEGKFKPLTPYDSALRPGGRWVKKTKKTLELGLNKTLFNIPVSFHAKHGSTSCLNPIKHNREKSPNPSTGCFALSNTLAACYGFDNPVKDPVCTIWLHLGFLFW